ncbi:carboxypeptidase regulatory-like domain-containing protein [Pedobacter sp. MC2016-15]|uniref:TonB-dependent receptor n=1 Tax=Pedobacter sp. MC2016-15 TaxID=2994473 RepID=UPI002245CB52|nr:carboxypeptidase regulatory-like domain-containing protein [Pedobacter sp. MC2016-15]MCX2479614.1 carboxypeptidase regulatory-like domain-containing protein [Pedobacter sp. MC2016-15]
MKKSLLLKFVVLIFAVAGTIFSANAQVTTSSMTGTIKDAKAPLPGASVKAIHTPTGTAYGVTTNADGRFTIGGMRVGGPYTIEVSFVGFAPQKIEGVNLKLGEAYVVNLVLSDNASNLSEVKVVGTNKNSVMNSNRNGTSTVVTRQQIQVLPQMSRSVNDITRLTPQSSGQNIGGGNYRSNNFTVDGANFNNQFGIGQNIPAGGSPISIDALEQISVNVTPYDVRQTGFTGGSVTAVTRSGTNKFTGSAFYTMRNDDLQGRKLDGFKLSDALVQPYDEKNFGFSLGGPIIKDKLFFFVNYERRNITQPGTARIAATPQLPYGSISNVVQAEASYLDRVKNYLINTYGYDPGVYQGYSNISNNEKIFARLDWNINKDHRFSVRYNSVESQSPFSASTSTSGSAIGSVTNFAYVNQRSGSNLNAGLPFSNSNYYQAQNLYSGVAELNSNFGSKVSNVLRATYSHQNDPRTTDGSPFPLVDILDGKPTSGTNLGSVLTTFGYEPFSYGNLRDVKTFTYSDDVSLALGKHNITLGAQAEFSTTKNGFQRFGTGFYTFNTFEDFMNAGPNAVNRAKPLQYTITYPLTADGSQAFPTFKFAQYSAYIQDEFNVTDRFKLTAGLRAEIATYPGVDEIRTHPLIAAQTFYNGETINTGELPKSRINWSPRFGFNWDVKGDRTLQVRGGSGIFTGRIPFVWIVSQSGDAGLLQYTQTYTGADVPFFNPSIAPNLTTPQGAVGTTIPGTISAMSKDLRFPQVWKSSLAFDVQLPWGIVGTLEGIYSKDLYAATAKNVNLKDPLFQGIAGYGDTRPFFAATANQRQQVNTTSAGIPSANGTATVNAIKMNNTKGGYNWSATAQLTKNFTQGLSLMAAYTRADGRNFGDQSGDQLLNLWSLPLTSGSPNSPQLSYSSNLNPHRVVASASYRKEYLKNLATSVSLIYEGESQGRYSYSYVGDLNRDGVAGNDLLYIPRDASDIEFSGALTVTKNGVPTTYTAQQQKDIFMAFIDQDPYLSKHKGELSKRNGAKLPWRNNVDFRLTQEVFRNIGDTKNSFQFTMDIFNVGNLLNRNWGNRSFVNSSQLLTIANTAANPVSPTQRPLFRLNPVANDVVRESFGTTQTISSTYYMQFGVRYLFQ